MKNLIFILTVICLSTVSTKLCAQNNWQTKTLESCAEFEKMPFDQLHNPALAEQMITFLKQTDNSAWHGDIVKIACIDEDWFLQRHEITGAILARYIHAEITVKRNANCRFYYLITFKQDYENGRFTNLLWYNSGDYSQIPCEHIN